MVPTADYCSAREVLIKAFVQAVSDYNFLQKKQLRAVLRDQSFPLEQEIAEARERRDRAKEAILTHRRMHDC